MKQYFSKILLSLFLSITFFITSHLIEVKNLIDAKKFDDAISLCKKKLLEDPENCYTYMFLGLAYSKKSDHLNALKNYRQILKLKPNDSKTWHNVALTLRKLQMVQEALDCYKKAIELEPNNENYHFGIAQAYLTLGDWKNGWKHMEFGRTSYLNCLKKRITCPSEIKGKTILIPRSWGMGDMIQFIRYTKKLKEYGAKEIILQTHAPLLKILSSCKYIDKITADRVITAEYEAQIALWSLPAIFNSTEETIPCKIPYLYANPTLVYKWSEKLKHDKNFKIGICWAGSGTDKARNIPLEKFEPLANVPGVSLYSIQKGNKKDLDQLENINFRVVNFGQKLDGEHGAFMDTAAIMKNMDLVITSDTSIPHLAGALGVPVWTFIIFAPDWRWLLERESTPWYPTMKLFRSEKPNDWDNVIEKMKIELEKIVNNF